VFGLCAADDEVKGEPTGELGGSHKRQTLALGLHCKGTLLQLTDRTLREHALGTLDMSNGGNAHYAI
jgi:hypothetical protein